MERALSESVLFLLKYRNDLSVLPKQEWIQTIEKHCFWLNNETEEQKKMTWRELITKLKEFPDEALDGQISGTDGHEIKDWHGLTAVWEGHYKEKPKLKIHFRKRGPMENANV